jgi:hypothetical protein
MYEDSRVHVPASVSPPTIADAESEGEDMGPRVDLQESGVSHTALEKDPMSSPFVIALLTATPSSFRR